MRTHHRFSRLPSASHRLLGLVASGSACLLVLGLAGCAGSEPVGHSKTTTKSTTETPTEKTTVTETHEKNTTLTPR